MGYMRWSASFGAAALFMAVTSTQMCSAKRTIGLADMRSAKQLNADKPSFSVMHQEHGAFKNLLRKRQAINDTSLREVRPVSQLHIGSIMRNNGTWETDLEHHDVEYLSDPLGSSGSSANEEYQAAALKYTRLQNVGVSTGEVFPVGSSQFWESMAGGTGATSGAFGIRELDADLIRRMRCQDKAVQLLLIFVYFVTLFFAASLTYNQCRNDSPVTYYADPRFHNMATEGNDLRSFLESFDTTPKQVQLQVTGFVPVPEEVANVKWKGDHYHVAFTFALDLSPWVVHDVNPDHGPSTGTESISEKDVQKIRYFLGSDRNDLSYVELAKQVEWPGWEELATNIKHRIRQNGFSGIIGIHRSEDEHVTVYKNKPWANFMYSHTTKVLCALSFFGWVFYFAYMLLRNKPTRVHSRYRVDVQINDFWQLIQDQLGADGFEEHAHSSLERRDT